MMQRFHVDHDHAAGRIRGLLCGRCNTAMGHLGDSIEMLTGLVQYLEIDTRSVQLYTKVAASRLQLARADLDVAI